VNKKKNISQEDIDIWNNYIKNPTDITNKDYIKTNNTSNSNRYKFDLHGFTLQEANKKVQELILLCSQNGYKEILLITGKGIHSNSDSDIYASKDLSKLRYSVPEYIRSNLSLSKYILSVESASKVDGGSGAIIIKLKRL